MVVSIFSLIVAFLGFLYSYRKDQLQLKVSFSWMPNDSEAVVTV